jgi:CHAD domain-containing protein
MASNSNPAVCAFGADVTQKYLSAFSKEIPGVLHSRDIEYVHRLRVASRRLDTAIKVFKTCHPEKKMKTWQKELHQVTSVLGRVRDQDIQAACIKSYLKATPSTDLRPGIRRLLLRVIQKRKRIQVILLDALKSLDQHQTLVSLDVRSRALKKSIKITDGMRSEEIYAYASGIILPVLEKFLSYDLFVDQVEAVKELHAMRIAAKKLRYTLECFAVIYPGNLVEFLSTMREIQDQLGTIHDCDVWQATSIWFIDRERQRAEKYFGSDRAMVRLMPGLLAFFEDRYQRRIETYNAFTRYWRELHQAHLWDKLQSQIAPMNIR